jgi:hypothetical protein
MRTGSHRNVLVRGQHRKEAVVFALGSATPLTSLNADRAAAQIVAAARAGRAHSTPGTQARAAEILHALVPGLVDELLAFATHRLLPGPARHSAGDLAKMSRDLDLGVVTRVFPTRAAVRFNQPSAVGEGSR